jgi:hypothetical protein
MKVQIFLRQRGCSLIGRAGRFAFYWFGFESRWLHKMNKVIKIFQDFCKLIELGNIAEPDNVTLGFNSTYLCAEWHWDNENHLEPHRMKVELMVGENGNAYVNISGCYKNSILFCEIDVLEFNIYDLLKYFTDIKVE